MACEYNDTISMATVDNCTKITDSPWKRPEFDVTAKNISIAIILILIDLITILGNLIVLLSFTVESKLRQPFNLFIFNLAVTDFLVAITAMTFYTIDTLLGYWPFGRVMCGVWIYFDFAMTFASVYTLVAISIDRFWCVTWSYTYKVKNTKTKVAIILAIVWVCVILTWTPPFYNDMETNHREQMKCIWEPNENREFVVFLAAVGHYTPCVIMVVCYLKVFFVMRRQAKRVAVNTPRATTTSSATNASGSCYTNGCQATDQYGNAASSSKFGGIDGTVASTNHLAVDMYGTGAKPGTSKTKCSNRQANTSSTSGSGFGSRDRKIFVTLTYVLMSYLVCWFPFYVAFDTYAWRPEAVPEGLYTFLFWMTYVNSTINPFIYAYTSQDFRNAFMKVLKLGSTCTCK